MAVKELNWDSKGVYSKNISSEGSFVRDCTGDSFSVEISPSGKSGRMFITDIARVFGNADIKINSITVKGRVAINGYSPAKLPSELYISVSGAGGKEEIARDREILKDAGIMLKSFSFVIDGQKLKNMTAFPEFGISGGTGIEIGIENTDPAEISAFYFEQISFSADCTLPMFTLTLKAEPEGAGTFIGGGTYEAGSEVRIQAAAKKLCQFSSWSDGSTENPRTLIIDKDVTLTAVFTEKRNIYAGTGAVREIYAGNKKVKAVYMGKKRIY